MKLRLGITKLITQVEPLVDEAEQKRSQLEEKKIGDAGTPSLENDTTTDLERVAAISG